METLPNSKSCFVCGLRNSSGLQLRFETDGVRVRTRFVPRPEHAGFVGVVHGGILATVLDEIMVWACAVQTRAFGYCAEMSVRFRSPARPGRKLEASAQLIENKRGRLYLAEAEIRADANILVATATGKYMPIPDFKFETFAADFEGTPETLQKWLAR